MSETSPSQQYEKQHRGTEADYEAYFAGMDASMQQKVALTTAHFPVRGRIADMGSGSGRGTFDLACLYQDLEMIGVDINPISVERARREFQRANLSYEVGDISAAVFPPNSLDGILNSSVLHHVTSFNNFDVNRVFATLDNQVTQLKAGGVIIIRDFVIPDGPEMVYLDLPETNGAESGSETELSSAALFELFAATWRSSLNRDHAFPFVKLKSPRNGFARYKVGLRAAAEFVLRKDYRADWQTEILEEYTYLSQSQFEQAFRSRGLRIVTSRPLWNPWIVQHRFEDKFYLSNLDGKPLPFPPTNYLIVGEKVSAGEGVQVTELESIPISTPKFLNLTAHKNRETNKVYELVERPNQTIDIVPWYQSNGQVFVFSKKDFPRPLVNACMEESRLNRASLSGYITEPISAIIQAEEDLHSAVKRVLQERASLTPSDVLEIGEPFFFYTSPGGVNERVMSCPVQVRRQGPYHASFPNYTKFTGAGTVRELDATQVLRACHVGGMFDARIEINIYRLLRELGHALGPWIGAPIDLSNQHSEFSPSDRTIFTPKAFQAFALQVARATSEFLSITEGVFGELDRNENELARVPFEYVKPRNLSLNTVVTLPVVKTEHDIFVGIEIRDLPAVQTFTGNSRIATAPAWRLPRTANHWTELPNFLRDVMQRDFSIRVLQVKELGGPYFASPGVTPEIVYPFVTEVEAEGISRSKCQFLALNELKTCLKLIQDGHLLINVSRLLHALEKVFD